MQRQTTIAKPSEIKRKWYVLDATDKPLGRMASEVAVILLGKNKPIFTPNVDCGDFIIIVNAEKVGLSGDKLHTKNYFNNTAKTTGGLRTRSAQVMVNEFPVEMIERAVWGMLPKGPLGRQIIKKLFVYKGPEHEHTAQKPEVLELKFVEGK